MPYFNWLTSGPYLTELNWETRAILFCLVLRSALHELVVIIITLLRRFTSSLNKRNHSSRNEFQTDRHRESMAPRTLTASWNVPLPPIIEIPHVPELLLLPARLQTPSFLGTTEQHLSHSTWAVFSSYRYYLWYFSLSSSSDLSLLSF